MDFSLYKKGTAGVCERNYPRQTNGWPSSDGDTYHYLLPESYRFRHKRGIWSNGLWTLLLGAPWTISWRCLRSYWPKRKGFHSHLRNPLHSHLFHIRLPKSEDLPFYTWCPEKSSYKVHSTPQVHDTPGSTKRWLDGDRFSKPSRLTAWSGSWNKASDARYQRQGKKVIFTQWVWLMFGKNRFSIKIEIDLF